MAFTNFKHDRPTRLQSSTAAKRAKAKAWTLLCRYVTARDERTCRACDRKVVATLNRQPDRAEHHHVTPKSIGGEDTKENLVLLCAGCHDLRHITRRLYLAGNAERVLRCTLFGQDGTILRKWESTR